MLKTVNATGTKHRNLILIGFMGSGKTTVGRSVAGSLGLQFVDTDQRIAEKADRTIPEIFETQGEAFFRRMETEVLKECAAHSGQVVSTGGGIVTVPENLEILRDMGFVVWLKASPAVIYDRVIRHSHRPLLQTDDPKKTIEDLMAVRDPLYHSARHLEIVTDELTLEETCHGVCESARLELGVG